MENKKLTNEVGAPVSENEHSLTSGQGVGRIRYIYLYP